jgi:FKBP-type peptidyl-prolyl cis-trans isomerase
MCVAGVGWGGGAAWAVGRSPADSAQGKSASAAREAQHRSKLPVIGNATNLAREPVVHATKGKPPSKLEVRDLVVGTGAKVSASSTVRVMYVGANYKTGKVFTQLTWTQRRPTSFPLSGVVPGFAEGLLGMKVGGRREIVIPPKLGYGDESTGPITANETLVFVVDLKGVSG